MVDVVMGLQSGLGVRRGRAGASARWAALFAGAVLCAGLPGCGGGSSQPAASTSASTSATQGATNGATRSATPSAPPVATGAGSGGSSADWVTYHRDPTRAGAVPGPALSLPLRRAWTARLDGAVYAQPLVVRGRVIAATEHDTVYALDPATGQALWKRSLGTAQPQSGLPCGNIDPLGVTGTPAYDPATGSLFAVAETTGGLHTLWALDGATGAPRWHRSLDVLADRNKKAEQHRAALLVAHGRVVTTFGGLAGDCDNYVGYATSVPTSGKGATTTYAVPTAREAGMWSPAGAVVGTNGHVYVASGNGAEVGGTWDKSDSVTELDPATMAPLSVFAPSTWADDNRADLDLGSSSPVPVPAVHRIVIAGKRGTVYLLPEHLGGIGSQAAALEGCQAYGGAARSGSDVVEPCKDGLRLLHVGSGSLSWGWQAAGITGSPVVVGGDVYATDESSGQLADVSLGAGAVRARVAVGQVSRFASPTPYAGRLFVPTLTGITAVAGS